MCGSGAVRRPGHDGRRMVSTGARADEDHVRLPPSCPPPRVGMAAEERLHRHSGGAFRLRGGGNTMAGGPTLGREC